MTVLLPLPVNVIESKALACQFSAVVLRGVDLQQHAHVEVHEALLERSQSVQSPLLTSNSLLGPPLASCKNLIRGPISSPELSPEQLQWQGPHIHLLVCAVTRKRHHLVVISITELDSCSWTEGSKSYPNQLSGHQWKLAKIGHIHRIKYMQPIKNLYC